MRNVTLFLMLFSAAILIETGYCGQPQEKWIDISDGIDEIDLKTVAIDTKNPDIIYVGSAKSIFKSPNTGKTWKKLYLIRGSQTAVNIISIDPKSPNIVYAGTQSGLFKSLDGGISWDKIFEGIGDQEKKIKHIAIEPENTETIYIGTANGLFISNDAGKSWDKSAGELSNQIINFITLNPFNTNIIYAATKTGVYKSTDSGLMWNRIFSVMAQTDEMETDEISENSNTNETIPASNKEPNCIGIDPQNSDKVYIGTNCGIFITADTGKTWEKLTTCGLTGNKISSLLSFEDGTLYVATDEGIFKISKPYNNWQEIYIGLFSKDSRCLAYHQKNHFILVATKKGIYKTHYNPNLTPHVVNVQFKQDPEIKNLLANFESEPSIQEIQQAAIQYAEVHKEKIDEWRRCAKRKAILPTLSINTNRYLTDYYHWDSGPNPDVLQKGKDTTDWSVTVSWNLGDLIWSTDQTSIDVRSRLMVQLRDDILDEVTRLYFERRRLQLDLLTNPPKNIQTKLQKELKLQELTAGIDALTDGHLSKKTQQTNL
ncbi:MAG: YCF48-related protein [Candidatus Omnitrophica bacterium]|nr:YCF48-related protein [Candidatus Omnitrophota bacterium]